MRRCPWCRKERPPTGGAFCNGHCTMKWFEWRTYATSGEFEADVPTALADPQMILLP